MILSLPVKVLAGACLVLLVLCAYLGVRLSVTKSALAASTSNSALCATVNQSQTEAISQLQALNSELVTKNAIDLAAAQDAAARYLALEAQYTSLESQNEALRDQLGRDHPETGQWLAAGMDSRVACSLWPEAAACKDRSR